MLRRRHLREAGLLAPRLHPQERDQRLDLLLDRLEARQRVELREQILERNRRVLAPQHVEIELVADLLAQVGTELPEGIERVRRHRLDRTPARPGLRYS